MNALEPSELPKSVPLLRWIMLAVLVWGLILAAGAYRFGGNQPLLKAIIIATCVVAFLGFWLAALALRQRRANHP